MQLRAVEELELRKDVVCFACCQWEAAAGLALTAVTSVVVPGADAFAELVDQWASVAEAERY